VDFLTAVWAIIVLFQPTSYAFFAEEVFPMKQHSSFALARVYNVGQIAETDGTGVIARAAVGHLGDTDWSQAREKRMARRECGGCV
jgi:hypothetical protein